MYSFSNSLTNCSQRLSQGNRDDFRVDFLFDVHCSTPHLAAGVMVRVMVKYFVIFNPVFMVLAST